MLNNVHVVILSSIKWNFLWQRHQILAQYLSDFTEVTYVETTGLRNPSIAKTMERLNRGLFNKVQNNLEVGHLNILPPIVTPPTNKIYRILNKKYFVPKLAKKIKSYSNKPILLIAYTPTKTSLDLIKNLKPVKIVYDCVLNFENFPGIPKDIDKTENDLINISDVLIVDSIHLLQKHTNKKADIIQIPAAVHFERFNQIYEEKIINSKVKKVAYFGGIDNYRIDWEIVKSLLSFNITVEFIGPAPEGIPIKHNKFIHKQMVAHQDLPNILLESDALILPYKVTEFTKGTFPAKLFECFATGKPIVATALPDLVVFNNVIDIGENVDSFTEKVIKAISSDHPNRREQRLELAKENSWEYRCNTYKEVLENLI